MKKFRLTILVAILMIVWGLANAQNTENSREVRQIVSSGNQQIIAVSYFDSSVNLLDSTSGNLLQTIDFSHLDIPLQRITLNPAGTRLAWTGGSGELAVYDRDTDESHIFKDGPGSISTSLIQWHPHDSTWLVTFPGDSPTYFDMNGSIAEATGGGIYVSGFVSDFKFSPDGTRAITSQFLPNSEPIKISVALWENVQKGGYFSEVDAAKILDTDMIYLSWSPDSQRIAMVVAPVGLTVYNIEQDIIEVEGAGVTLEPPMSNVQWSPDGKYIATGGIHLRIWDADNYTLLNPSSEIDASAGMVWSPDSEYIYAGGDDGLLRIEIATIIEIDE